MTEHNDIVAGIASRFVQRGFKARTTDNNLPPGKPSNETLYRPDIIVRNQNDQILWLVEVETSEGGKAVAGAAILADVCMQRMNVEGKPKLLFVFYRAGSNLGLAKKRLNALEERIRYVRIPPPVTYEASLKLISQLG